MYVLAADIESKLLMLQSTLRKTLHKKLLYVIQGVCKCLQTMMSIMLLTCPQLGSDAD